MSRPIASEVRVSAHGVVAIGREKSGARVYFRPNGVTRFQLLALRFAPPPGPPATLLPDGRLLVVGRGGEGLLVNAGRSPQPAPSLPQVPVEGLSADGVAYARGPVFFRFVAGAWVDERGVANTAPREVHAVGDFAVGDDGDAWVPGRPWASAATKTTVRLTCAGGAWAAGEGVALQRTAKRFVAHPVRGAATSICPWKDGALLVVDGRLVDLGGAVFKAPGHVTSVAAHGDVLWCVANGSLFESSDLRRFRRQVLPS
jgi:hypothetical protein